MTTYIISTQNIENIKYTGTFRGAKMRAARLVKEDRVAGLVKAYIEDEDGGLIARAEYGKSGVDSCLSCYGWEVF